MPKYVKKPKGVDAFSQSEGGAPPAWVEELIAADRLRQDGAGWSLSFGLATMPVGPTDWLVNDPDGVRVLSDAAFQDEYAQDTRAGA